MSTHSPSPALASGRALSRFSRQNTWRLWFYVAAGLLGVVLFGAADTRRTYYPQVPAAPSAPATPAATSPPAAAPQPAAAPSPLDEPLRLLGLARQTFQNVRDYTCLLVKQEQINGRLQPHHYISLKVRNQPFSVYMNWQAPKPLAGQEVCYVAGRNNGMMRVHSTGLLGAVGFVSIDPNDPRARQHSRHTITEAGIGNLLARFDKQWQAERAWNQTQVRVAEYEFNGRRCTRVETLHPQGQGRGGPFTSYRNVLYFDKEHTLPVRVEVYDWPRAGGSPDGDLVEVYSYVNLRFNVGLGDEVFNR